MKILKRKDIPLVSDAAFRYVFGEKESIPILQAMLNAFLQALCIPPVVAIDVVDGRLGSRWSRDKTVYLDVLARDDSGRSIDIEIQTYRQDYYLERSLYYWSRLFSGQLRRGSDYTSLKPVICINLLDYVHYPDTEWLTVDKLHHSEHLMICTVELPKIADSPLIPAQLWGKFISSAGRNRDLAQTLAGQDPDILLAARRYAMFATGVFGLRSWIERREKYRRDFAGVVAYAKKTGLAEGKAEQAREIARRLKAQGSSPAEIAALTDLSAEEVAAL